MPLPTANTAYPLSSFMHTFGPIPENITREDISKVMKSHYDDIEKMIIAIETSGEGYRHCHVAMKFKKTRKVQVKVKKSLIAAKIIVEDESGRKPNMGTHSVPQKECHGGSAFAVLEKYLINPKKLKEVDGEMIVDEPDPVELSKMKISRDIENNKSGWQANGRPTPLYPKSVLDSYEKWSEMQRKMGKPWQQCSVMYYMALQEW